MSKIVTVKIRESAYAKTPDVWQHNYGQILRITGIDLPTAVEVHFSLQGKAGDTLVRVGTTMDGVTEVRIPDEYLKNSGRTSNYSIYAFIYLTDETSGITEYRIEIPVNARPKPTSPGEDPEVDPDLFRETVTAVNDAADRAEKAVESAKESAASAEESLAEIKEVSGDLSEQIKQANTVDESLKEQIGSAAKIQENVNQIAKNKEDIGLLNEEKITRPQTAEVGQVLAVKEIDSDGKPTDFEATDMTGGISEEDLKKAVDTALEETLEDAVPVTVEERTPLWTPESAEVGQLLRIQSINDDGSVVLETVEVPSESVSDVRIDGTSIVEGGVAEIPKASNGATGVIKMGAIWYTAIGIANDGALQVQKAQSEHIDKRYPHNAGVIMPNNLDYAVKAAMCDGKGAEWTADEQKASRERQGIYDWEDIADITLEEDSMVDIDLNGNFKDLYIYINQENATNPIIGSTYLYPYCDKNVKNSFYSQNQATTSYYINAGSIWHHNEKLTYRYGFATTAQKENASYPLNIKVWDKNDLANADNIYPSTPFIGVRSSPTMFKSGTRFVVKGVRA